MDYVDVNCAKIDIQRLQRKGYSEAIFCECKTNEQLIKIFKTFKDNNQNAIGTRASVEQYSALKKVYPEINYNIEARILTLINKEIEKIGEVAVCCAGTGDIPIAQEASFTAEFYGSNVKRYFDVGVAGIHRLFDKIDDIKKANVIVAAAGMEGALPSVISGMVDVPVIALPTSVGYGTSMKGITALLAMLNSCAEGITVVNIDNGFGAGYSANQINRAIAKGQNR